MKTLKTFGLIMALMFTQSVMAEDAKVTKIYLDTVTEYAKITNFAENASKVAAGKFKIDLLNDPQYASIVTDSFINDITQFFYEIFISQETVQELAKIYSGYFSIDEMVELIRFSKSPLGAKMIQVGPQLMIDTQKLGLDLVQKHEKEFVQVLSEHIKRVHRGGQ